MVRRQALFIGFRNGYPRPVPTQRTQQMPAKNRPASTRKPRPTPRSRLKPDNLLQQMGALRVTLVAGAILDMLVAPSPGTPVIYAGMGLVTTLIVPVLAPILLQVLLLDALMGRVLMSSHTGAERVRYRRIMIVNLVIAFALVLRWTPYFLAIGNS